MSEQRIFMEHKIDLSRFIEAQKKSYPAALCEIRNGRKTSHWMWYIFPQIHGLGRSPISQYYAIQSLEEAKAFLQDPYLGGNLLEISEVLLALQTNNRTEVFGKLDDMKLWSCMTLFSVVSEEDSVFCQVLDKYYQGRADRKTLGILGISKEGQNS